MVMAYNKDNTDSLRAAKAEKLSLQAKKITDEFEDIITILDAAQAAHPHQSNQTNIKFEHLKLAIVELENELIRSIQSTSKHNPIPDDQCGEAYQLALHLKKSIIIVNDETIDFKTKQKELDYLQQFTRGGPFSPKILPLIKGILAGLLYIAVVTTFFLATGMLMLDGGFSSFMTGATIFGGGLGTMYQTKQYQTAKVKETDLKTDKVVSTLKKFLERPSSSGLFNKPVTTKQTDTHAASDKPSPQPA